jgi:hypothetical protein
MAVDTRFGPQTALALAVEEVMTGEFM